MKKLLRVLSLLLLSASICMAAEESRPFPVNALKLK